MLLLNVEVFWLAVSASVWAMVTRNRKKQINDLPNVFVGLVARRLHGRKGRGPAKLHVAEGGRGPEALLPPPPPARVSGAMAPGSGR